MSSTALPDPPRSHRLTSRAGLAAGLACLIGIVLTASRQQAAPPQFRSGVDVVHLDVSVLDRDRRPVRGLTPADFVVTEEGKPQRITVFSAVDIDDPPPSTVEWVREVASDVRTNEGIEERRLFLLIIDDAMIEADLEALRNTKEIANKVIDRLGPSDLAAVVFTRDNSNSQDYTSDRTRLRTAVGKSTVGFRGMGMDDLYWIYSAGVVERAVEALTALPDRRKSVIYIGQGVPVDLGLLGPQVPTPMVPGQASGIAAQGLVRQVMDRIERAFDHARLANVTVYPVDVCGLRVIKYPPPPPTCQPGLEIDYLQTLASNTGGRAVINTNEFTQGVRAIFDENASYYLLGYQPETPASDGKLRRIDVRVKRPGVQVRARSAYRSEKARDAERRRAMLAKAPLGAALAGLLPKSDLPLQVGAFAVPLPGRKESAVAIVVGIRQPIRASDQRTVERVDLQISAFNVEGKPFGTIRHGIDVTIRPNATGLAAYEVLSRLDLRPGRYQLRVAAHIGSLSTSGSLYYDVDVPDVSKARVSLSPLVLSASPAPVIAARDAFAGLLPVLPTTRRTFAASDDVVAFARVYQGGRSADTPVSLRMVLQDQNGRVVMDREETLPAAAFGATRSADVRVPLSTAQLTRGDYLLSIETAGASPVRRAIRFQID